MKYPFDCVTLMTKKKTFSIEPRFSLQTEESPLKIFHPSFSRFVMTVISEGKAAKCNIPVSALADMKMRTSYAFDKYLEFTSRPSAGEGNTSPAYTRRFFSGSLKGKTPADVLAEKGEEGKKILNAQYVWLKNNLAKFPKNRELMDAIIDAKNVDLQAVSNSTSVAPPVITLLDIDCRPLQRKTRGDGLCFCYEAHITFDASRNYPVNVKVVNYYAPVKKRDDGTLNVILSEKDKSSEMVNDFSMSAADWNNALDMLTLAKDSFYMSNFSNALKMATDAEIANINANKAQDASTQFRSA